MAFFSTSAGSVLLHLPPLSLSIFVHSLHLFVRCLACKNIRGCLKTHKHSKICDCQRDTGSNSRTKLYKHQIHIYWEKRKLWNNFKMHDPNRISFISMPLIAKKVPLKLDCKPLYNPWEKVVRNGRMDWQTEERNKHNMILIPPTKQMFG